MQKLIKDYIAENTELLYSTLKDLCLIPAPSHFEHERAKYCKAWLEKYGAKGVYIDEAQNTIFPLNCDGSNEITVFAAHLDTVFPDKEPLPYSDDGVNVYCPGCSEGCRRTDYDRGGCSSDISRTSESFPCICL